MILKKSKLFSIVVCMITVLSVLSLMIPRNVSADSNERSLTLVCVSDDTILVGMNWKIYKVGRRTASKNNFVQTGDFSGIQVNMSRLTPERIQQAAQTFQSYAIASGIQPLQAGVTNERGEVQFSGLDSGLYLLSGTLLKIGTHYYQPATTLVELKEDDSNLAYNAYPKFSEYEVANGEVRAHVVYKEWVGDEEHLDMRPDHVIVDIYKNEEYYQTVTLNEANRWRYRWTESGDMSNWIVMEKNPPENYEVNIEYDTNYRIQNSYNDVPFTTTTVPVETVTTTTTTAISVEQINTGVSTTTATTVSSDNNKVSRTRTTALTNVSNASAVNTRTTTTTTNAVESGAVTETNNTTTRQEDTSTTTASTEDVSSTSVANETTTTTNVSSGNGSNSGSGGNSGGKSNNSSSSTKLPQTGQLWWPVVPLSIGGVLCLSAGLVIRIRRKSDD
ncbi:MAG: hypothetical protein K2K66_08070 [Ruminococcus sp.]|nr:hypothetical protein [Ruminococcus sp.]